MTIEPPLHVEIVEFWREAGPDRWFAKDEAFDDQIRERYEPVHQAAARGEYADWSETAEGSLALILVLDQFPRNLYRGSAHAFAADAMARAVARTAVAQGHDKGFEEGIRAFLYLPFEHSEDPADQGRSVALFEALGIEHYTRFAHLHRDLIQRFGRFPHRNPVMGRESTAEEIAYMAGGGFKG